MIFGAFIKALAQLGDPRFRRVMYWGVGLTLALLVAIYALFLWAIQTFVPAAIEIPFVGPVSGLGTLLSWGSALLMIVLSVFLMMPVASAFTSMFLDDVSQAVEDRHYPTLPPALKQSFGDAMVDTLNFFGLLVALNVLALMLYPFAGPFIPVVFWAVNGMLLGREYFTLVAARRLGRPAAKALRKRHWLTVWWAGSLMAAPLSIPLVNLFIPVLGAATFTHLFHLLNNQLPR
ncbi:EI24 domain-containing protein [Pseudorhodobacter aquimaris]|uniref:EI24 domain-containing protein n=1 Tax=Pseudorhodobacter aquimaris TaxID=687412 RepID=UPI00067B6058|nr:EI24 domain-containing protein [Pseudorhodobacter aquimaris]